MILAGEKLPSGLMWSSSEAIAACIESYNRTVALLFHSSLFHSFCFKSDVIAAVFFFIILFFSQLISQDLCNSLGVRMFKPLTARWQCCEVFFEVFAVTNMESALKRWSWVL